MNDLLLPPEQEGSGGRHKAADLREAFFSEKEERSSWLGNCWPVFRDTLAGRLRQDFKVERTENPGKSAHARGRTWWRRAAARTPRLRDSRRAGDHSGPESFAGGFVRKTQEDWGTSWARKQNREPLACVLPAPLRHWVDDSFLEHYAWANQLSIFYATQYRSSFLLNFLLAALAVFFALVSAALGLKHHAEIPGIAIELALIVAIILLTRHGRKHRWHERWIDYRALAERLRLARFLALLGGGGQAVTVPGHLATYGNPAATWMHWHYRAIERAAGLPRFKGAPGGTAVTFDSSYLKACRELLVESLAEDQKAYHRDNAVRLDRVDHRLHALGDGMFMATLVVCVAHVGLSLAPAPSLPDWPSRWLTLLAALLPTLGAACAAIRSQGEFHRVVQRSEAMQEKLEQLQLALADVPCRPGESNSVRLRESAVQLAQLMANEVLDWRVVFQDRPLGLPA